MTVTVLGTVAVSSSLSGPVDPSFRALSGRLKFTVRRYEFNKDSPPFHGQGRGLCDCHCPSTTCSMWPTTCHHVTVLAQRAVSGPPGTNVQRFRGGFVFKAHGLWVSLNSGLESDEGREEVGRGMQNADPRYRPGAYIHRWCTYIHRWCTYIHRWCTYIHHPGTDIYRPGADGPLLGVPGGPQRAPWYTQ